MNKMRKGNDTWHIKQIRQQKYKVFGQRTAREVLIILHHSLLLSLFNSD